MLTVPVDYRICVLRDRGLIAADGMFNGRHAESLISGMRGSTLFTPSSRDTFFVDSSVPNDPWKAAFRVVGKIYSATRQLRRSLQPCSAGTEGAGGGERERDDLGWAKSAGFRHQGGEMKAHGHGSFPPQEQIRIPRRTASETTDDILPMEEGR